MFTTTISIKIAWTSKSTQLSRFSHFLEIQTNIYPELSIYFGFEPELIVQYATTLTCVRFALLPFQLSRINRCRSNFFTRFCFRLQLTERSMLHCFQVPLSKNQVKLKYLCRDWRIIRKVSFICKTHFTLYHIKWLYINFKTESLHCPFSRNTVVRLWSAWLGDVIRPSNRKTKTAHIFKTYRPCQAN